jgi:DNA-binding response OmpR family regulator
MVTLNDPSSSQILIVEDEIEIRELMSLLLLRQGYQVQHCGSAVEAVKMTAEKNYDLIVLDWMLPQMSGLEFLAARQSNLKTSQPVLMVTAKTEPQDIVAGLEAGADDYITKPFEPAVFSARVKALLRRAHKLQTTNQTLDVLVFGELSINLITYEVKTGNQLIHLTPSEFKILATMAQSQGRVMTRDQLIEIVQGEGISVTGRTVDTHVFGLRKKLGASAEWVETIRGVGYRVKMDLNSNE